MRDPHGDEGSRLSHRWKVKWMRPRLRDWEKGSLSGLRNRWRGPLRDSPEMLPAHCLLCRWKTEVLTRTGVGVDISLPAIAC